MVQQPPQGGSRKISFNVSEQYEIQDVIGEGAYGVVWWVITIVHSDNQASRLTCPARLSTNPLVRKLPLRRLRPSITPCSACGLCVK
jgi:hypothetical protein